jgi:1-deoxy-D-xylulose-5-phosphate synthase
MLSTVPGMTVLAPASFAELENMLRWAVMDCTGPVALRYPRGGEQGYREDCGMEPVSLLREGTEVTLVTHGILTGTVLRAAELLAEQGISAQVVKINRVCPLEAEPLRRWAAQTGRVLVAEEVASQGCVGEALAADFTVHRVPLKGFRMCNCGREFIPHGSVSQLRERLGLTAEQLAQSAADMVREQEA